MSFNNWKKRLEIAQQHKTVAARRAAVAALKINFSQPGEADEGYYRKPVTEKDPSGNGHNIIIDWIPVAYFLYEGVLVGNIGAGEQSRDMTEREVGDEELWSWVVSNPISYELYKGVVEDGASWPDLASQMVGAMEITGATESRIDAETIPPLGRRADENKSPEAPVVATAGDHAEQIDRAIADVPAAPYQTEEAVAAATGAKNRIAELRLKTDKAGKAIYQPLHAAYVAERDQWLPIVNRAEAAEKRIGIAVLTFRESERRRLAAIAAQAIEDRRLEDEANERAAQRAIAAGAPEPEPVIEEIQEPIVQPSPIVPTYGTRKVKEELKKFPVINDWDALYNYFKQTTEVKMVLTTLATHAIRAGDTIPGVTTREGLI